MNEILDNIGVCNCGLVYLLASLLVLVGTVIIIRTEDQEISDWIIMDKEEK